MLGKNKNGATGATPAGASKSATDVTPSAVTTPAHTPRPGAKNRPTPKRKDQEAARRRPLVETDRKAAKDAERTKTRAAREAQRAAAARGEDSALPLRDRGPEKRFIRNEVDSRLSIGEIAMPLMFVLIIVWFMPFPHRATIAMVTLLVVWLLILAGVIDAVLMWRRIKKALLAKFGNVPRGSAPYAVTRAMQMRFARFPRPLVKRGGTPR